MADVEKSAATQVEGDAADTNGAATAEEVASASSLTAAGSNSESPKSDGDDNNGTTVQDEANAPSNENSADLTKLERAIIRQIEYYFGDANLNRDKFLLENISKNEDGWVPLSVLTTFKRLAGLSKDFNVITDALMKSDEGLVEISDDKQSLRRHPERPIPEHNDEHRKNIQARTIYVKGFPLETQLSEIIDYFDQHGNIANITMRKYLDHPTKSYKFKGSVFVTFATKSQADDFIGKSNVQFKNVPMLRKYQNDYFEEKKLEREKRNAKKEKKQKKVEDFSVDLPKNAVIYFEGAAVSTSREELRQEFEKIKGDCGIAFIDYSRGDPSGFVRFSKENNATEFLERVVDNKIKINDDLDVTVRKATAEEEKQVLNNAAEFIKKRYDFCRNKKKNHHGRKRGHGHDRRHNGNDAKQAKLD